MDIRNHENDCLSTETLILYNTMELESYKLMQ